MFEETIFYPKDIRQLNRNIFSWNFGLQSIDKMVTKQFGTYSKRFFPFRMYNQPNFG